MIKTDFFSAFSWKLSEVIERYNENFDTVHNNVEGVAGMVREVIEVMKQLSNSSTNKADAESHSLNRTAKFVSIDK